MLHPPPTQEFIDTVRVIARFVVRLPVVLFCAALSQTDYAYALTVLMMLSITFCLIWGALRQERLFGPSLTNWDEAAAYACIASLAFKFAQS